MYTHTQPGWLVRIATAPILVVGFVAAFSGGEDAWISLLVFAFYALILVLFGSLTVTIDDSYVRVAFGVGLVRKRFPLAEIDSAEVVRNPWYYFWGIRWYGRGILYNISGLDGVLIRLAGSREARIGTDEPAKLAAAIEAATVERC
jgi:hypothetical protein